MRRRFAPGYVPADQSGPGMGACDLDSKTRRTTWITTPIAGLGDGGGFSEQSSDMISIEFLKGTKAALLAVSAPGMTADAVAALAQKVAANL